MKIKYFVLLFFLPLSLFGQDDPAITLLKVDDSVWVHRTYKQFGTAHYASNGMIVQTPAGILLIDTPWDDSLTVKLLNVVHNRFHQKICLAIITHAHDDRIGGIRTLQKNKIRVLGGIRAWEKAKEKGFGMPEPVWADDTLFNVGSTAVELFYAGAGHTADNSVVWLEQKKILFGGCLIKDESAQNLGNIAEADLRQWPRSIQALMERYSMVRIIVPGHGEWAGKQLMQHTIELLSHPQE